MEKILLFQVSNTTVTAVKKAAAIYKIKVINVPPKQYGLKLGELAENRADLKMSSPQASLPVTLPDESLMIFCGVTEKHLDKLLAALRQERVVIDYKAILTPTNQSWTLNQMYFEMAREKAQISRATGR